MKQILIIIGFCIFTYVCYHAGKAIGDTTIFGICIIIGILAVMSKINKLRKEVKSK